MTRGGILLAAALLGAGLRGIGGCDLGVAGSDDAVPEADAGSITYSSNSAGQTDAATVVVVPAYDAGSVSSTLVGGASVAVSPLCTGSALDAGVACDPGSPVCTPPVSSPADEGGGADAAAFSYDAATGAVTSFSCHVTAVHAEAGAEVAPVCGPSGAGGDDAACSSSSDCAPAFECVVDDSRADTGAADGATPAAVSGVCRRYCCADTCPSAGSYCDIETTVTGSVSVPVCVSGAKGAAAMMGDASAACDLLEEGTCSPGLTCQVVNKDTGQVACVTPGTATAGQSCEVDKCAAGLSCIAGTFPNRKCAELCDQQSADCPPGQMCMPTSAVLSSVNAQIGVCSTGE